MVANKSMFERTRRIGLLGVTGSLGLKVIDQIESLPNASEEYCLILRDYSDGLRLSHSKLPMRFFCECDATQIYSDIDTLIHMVMGNDTEFLPSLRSWQSAVKLRPTRIVFVSSSVVYGGVEPDYQLGVIPTRHPLADSYALAKLECESFLKHHASSDFQVCILRPSIVYGAGSNWVMEAVESILSNQCALPSDGNGFANLILVDDLARLCMKMATSPTIQDFAAVPVGDGAPTTWRKFYEEIAFAMGHVSVSVVEPTISPKARRTKAHKLLTSVRESSVYEKIQRKIPRSMRSFGLSFLMPPQGLKSVVEQFTEFSSKPNPAISESLAALFSTKWQIDNNRIPNEYRLDAYTSLRDGCANSIAWMLSQGFCS
jgi:nucleoside-diphosphate-sugar epimerase